MNKDDVIRMAQESHLIGMRPCPDGIYEKALQNFAALIAAAERKECAKLCDEQVERSKEALAKAKRVTDQAVYRSGAQTAAWNAAAIRARGQ